METKLSYKLPVFEGPLDLLLALISKNKLNIYDINVCELLRQYMEQIDAMRERNMDVASEFLEMAARLVYIKSVMLLPKHEEADTLREQLTGELLEYQVCKEMAQKLSQMSDGFGCFTREAMKIKSDKSYRRTHDSDELVSAYLAAVGRGRRRLPPPTDSFKPLVAKPFVTVSSKIVYVLRNLWSGKSVRFRSLFTGSKNRSELVATFLAVLELVRARRVALDDSQGDMTVKVCKEERTHVR
jgi:segregation and condensation protein A